MRSDTAFFSAAVIGRRFLSGLASDLFSAVSAAGGFLVEEDRREVERDAGRTDAASICSTSVNALIMPSRAQGKVAFSLAAGADAVRGPRSASGATGARASRCRREARKPPATARSAASTLAGRRMP